jgi:hypothetical protein
MYFVYISIPYRVKRNMCFYVNIDFATSDLATSTLLQRLAPQQWKRHFQRHLSPWQTLYLI